MLLNSCATPVASRPIASSFWLCCNCSASSRSAVMSTPTTTIRLSRSTSPSGLKKKPTVSSRPSRPWIGKGIPSAGGALPAAAPSASRKARAESPISRSQNRPSPVTSPRANPVSRSAARFQRMTRPSSSTTAMNAAEVSIICSWNRSSAACRSKAAASSRCARRSSLMSRSTHCIAGASRNSTRVASASTSCCRPSRPRTVSSHGPAGAAGGRPRASSPSPSSGRSAAPERKRRAARFE